MTTETKEVVVTIQESKATEGRNGPQWELKVRWPWTNPDSHFSDTVWLDHKDFKRQPPPGAFNVVVAQKSLKKKRDGSTHDGSLPWMWNYSITKFLSAAEMPTQTQQPAASGNTAPLVPQSGSQDDYRRSKEEMRWTEAYHMATRMVGPFTEMEVPEMVVQEQEALIVSWAGWFYNELAASTAPISDQAEEDGPYQASEEPPPAFALDEDLPF